MSRGKTRIKGLLLFAAVVFLLTVAQSYASKPLDKGGGAGDGPTPFSDSGRAAELADGETYRLVGTIRFYKGTPYFEVDLKQHSWLANAKRKASPFYPIEASGGYMRRFENQRVLFVAEVHGTIMKSGNGYEYVLLLYPLADPVIYSSVLNVEQN